MFKIHYTITIFIYINYLKLYSLHKTHERMINMGNTSNKKKFTELVTFLKKNWSDISKPFEGFVGALPGDTGILKNIGFARIILKKTPAWTKVFEAIKDESLRKSKKQIESFRTELKDVETADFLDSLTVTNTFGKDGKEKTKTMTGKPREILKSLLNKEENIAKTDSKEHSKTTGTSHPVHYVIPLISEMHQQAANYVQTNMGEALDKLKEVDTEKLENCLIGVKQLRILTKTKSH